MNEEKLFTVQKLDSKGWRKEAIAAKIVRALILKPLMILTLPIALIYRVYRWVWDGTIFGFKA